MEEEEEARAAGSKDEEAYSWKCPRCSKVLEAMGKKRGYYQRYRHMVLNHGELRVPVDKERADASRKRGAKSARSAEFREWQKAAVADCVGDGMRRGHMYARTSAHGRCIDRLQTMVDPGAVAVQTLLTQRIEL